MIKKLLHNLVVPHSGDEDSQRKEFILNVLLVSSLTLFGVASIVSFFISFVRPDKGRSELSIIIVLVIFGLLTLLYGASRRGFFKAVAYVLVSIFLCFAIFMGYRWGVDVTASLLLYTLVIVMAGILVSTRFAFISTALIGVTLLVMGRLQATGILTMDRYWRTQEWHDSDTFMTIIIFLVIATVSWLSNREIERSLRRAHRSEADLRKERDMLEVTVEERTKELKEAQIEKVSQLYRFAEFGRLSSGLFHDLMNPLTAVSLNIEQAKLEKENIGDISKAQQYLDQAFSAAQRMERFIAAVRKQIQNKGEVKHFSLTEETQAIIDILSYKAHLARVHVRFVSREPVYTTGDPIRWGQVILNLVGNAIDAYDDVSDERERIVKISLNEKSRKIICKVADHGVGIPTANLQKIFEPFFTTKPQQPTKGTGIGLSITKAIIEKDFNGTIAVNSAPATGTVFTIALSA